jgi:hypothetical protein
MREGVKKLINDSKQGHDAKISRKPMQVIDNVGRIMKNSETCVNIMRDGVLKSLKATYVELGQAVWLPVSTIEKCTDFGGGNCLSNLTGRSRMTRLSYADMRQD